MKGLPEECSEGRAQSFGFSATSASKVEHWRKLGDSLLSLPGGGLCLRGWRLRIGSGRGGAG
eukprot:6465966-Amphidinium_carterae.1